MKITVPKQLKNETFIVLGVKSKEPLDGIAWSKPEEQHDAEWIEKYCNNSGANYGVLYKGNLCVIDADVFGAFTGCVVPFDTYMVKSGRDTDDYLKSGMHFYFHITDTDHEYLGKKLILFKDGYEGEIGDIRFPGFRGYNVAPYCIHQKSGKQYLPINEETPVRDISIDEILSIFKENGIEYKAKEKPASFTRIEAADNGLDDYPTSVLDWLMPDNAHRMRDGEIEGCHPIHGSTTGTNLTISYDGMKWWCRRHNTGGGIIKAIAVAKNIIDCSDANGELTPEQIQQCYRILDERYPEVAAKHRAEFKQRKHEEQLARIAEADKHMADAGMCESSCTQEEPCEPEVVAVEEKSPAETPVWERITPIRNLETPMMDTMYPYTDDGNARRFEVEAKGWLIHDYPTKTWYAWDKTRWTVANQKLNQAMRFVGRTVGVEYLPDSEAKFQDYNERTPEKNRYNAWSRKHAEWTEKSQMHRKQKDMVNMAVSNMSVDLSEVSDMELLACKNGIIDTLNGVFYPMSEIDKFKYRYPTCYVDCTYTPGAVSQKWVNHLNIAMTDNKTEGLTQEEIENRRDSLVKYLNRLFGMMLVDGNPKQIFVFFWGEGKNGKSTTTNIILDVLGEQSANPTMTQLYASDTDKPSPSIVNAIKKRVAIFGEAEGDAPISSGAFKELVGDKVTERFRSMSENNKRLKIHCVPIGATNGLPEFNEVLGEGLQRRIITIPFMHYFDAAQENIVEDILTEKDAIFSMFVDEMILFRKEGMIEPPTCACSTKIQLLVGADMYTYLTTVTTPDVNSQMSRAELCSFYLSWAERVGVNVATRTVRNASDGNVITTLSKGEKNKLCAAARLMGYSEKTIHGIKYFCAKYIYKN